MSQQRSPGLRETLRIIRDRRRALRSHFDLERDFEELAESCTPSYLHPNPLAAGISWWRLFACARLLQEVGARGPILDFGSSTGEIFHLLPEKVPYHFVERDRKLAKALMAFNPAAEEADLDRVPRGSFPAILALDSLEHNEDVEALVEQLLWSLRPDGHLIVSGPTENALYRLGRRVAGFPGDYHVETIYDIERRLESRAERIRLRSIPMPLLSLFRLSVWRKRPVAPR